MLKTSKESPFVGVVRGRKRRCGREGVGGGESEWKKK